jgi:hypothetical protein
MSYDPYWWQGRSSRRSDMQVYKIIEEIALRFGIPPEAIRLVTPDGHEHRPCDLLAALRSEWENECGEFFWREWRLARKDDQ